MRVIIAILFLCVTLFSCSMTNNLVYNACSADDENYVPQNTNHIENTVSPKAESAGNAGSQGPHGSNAHFYEK